jgi:hypothetical protein
MHYTIRKKKQWWWSSSCSAWNNADEAAIDPPADKGDEPAATPFLADEEWCMVPRIV